MAEAFTRPRPRESFSHVVEVEPDGAARAHSQTSITLVTWFPGIPAGSLQGTALETGDLDADLAALQGPAGTLAGS